MVQITLHGWLGKYGDMGGGAGGDLSVGGGSEEDAGINVVEGPEAGVKEMQEMLGMMEMKKLMMQSCWCHQVKTTTHQAA